MARAGTLFRRAGRGSITGTKPFTDSNFNFELKNDHGRFENRHQMFKFRFETIIVFIYKYDISQTAHGSVPAPALAEAPNTETPANSWQKAASDSRKQQSISSPRKQSASPPRRQDTRDSMERYTNLIFIKVTCFVYNFSKLENNQSF